MKHWKTKEEMGGGFAYNEKFHEEWSYNTLIKVKPEEKNTMRTNYLIRDIWKYEQLLELKKFLNNIIRERKADEGSN